MGHLESSELAKPVELVKGEKLTEEQMGNLISAVGNHPAKAMTLLTMSDGNIYSEGDLHETLLSYQGEPIGWSMSRPVPFNYCTDSLAPIGLVTKEVLNSDLSTYGYQITDYGRRIGIPFCGLMLDWAEKHDVSLITLWGKTGSSSRPMKTIEAVTGEDSEFKKRAPITTLKILFELLTTPDPSMRVVDLQNRINEPLQTISGHLVRLDRADLIQYRSIEANKPFSAYKLAPHQPTNELPTYHTLKSLIRAVFSVCQQYPNSYLTIEDINNLLSQDTKKRWSEGSRKIFIPSILAFLKRKKYVEVKQFYGGLHSEITVRDDQRLVLTELLEIIDRFQEQDPEIVTKGRKLALEIINHPTFVSDILRKVKKTSPQVNQTPTPETLDLISYLINSHPGITNNEIQHLLELEDKKLGAPSIRVLTAILAVKNSVRVTKEGNVKRFFPKDT